MEQADCLETRKPRSPDTGRRLGVNVLFTNGERHKQQRKILMPALSRVAVKNYYDDMVEITLRHLDDWKGRDSIDLDRAMSDLAMSTGSKIFFGIDADSGTSGMARMMGELVQLLFSPAAMIRVDLPGFPYRRLRMLFGTIDQMLEAEIERKKSAGATGQDILSTLVRLHLEDDQQVTADELIGQAFTIFFAGHDTTAKALVWILLLVAQHPEVAAALCQELEDELKGQPPTIAQVMALPVLDRVVKEGLRILSPAIMFGRTVVKPIAIADFEVPPGSEVFYSPYIVHHDPNIFPNPELFDPDRWLTIAPDKYEYLPFGVGHRTCLGAHLASFQLRLVIALIVQRYRLTLIPGSRIDLKTNVVIGPKPAIWARVLPQDRNYSNNAVPVRGYIRKMVDFPAG